MRIAFSDNCDGDAQGAMLDAAKGYVVRVTYWTSSGNLDTTDIYLEDVDNMCFGGPVFHEDEDYIDETAPRRGFTYGEVDEVMIY